MARVKCQVGVGKVNPFQRIIGGPVVQVAETIEVGHFFDEWIEVAQVLPVELVRTSTRLRYDDREVTVCRVFCAVSEKNLVMERFQPSPAIVSSEAMAVF